MRALALLALPLVLAAASAPGTERVVRKARPAFGVVVETIVRVDGDDAARAAAGAAEAALDEVQRVERLVSEADEKSPIAVLNRSAGDEPVVMDPEVFFVLSEVQRLAKLTKGAFDVTAGAYSDAWKFKQDAPVPAKGALDKSKAVVGYDDLVLDAASRTARLRSPGARIGLADVARGYALEKAAQLLEARGYKDFIVSAGGDLVVRGQKGERPWMVGVQDPRAPGHFAALPAPVALPGGDAGAVMTSGDYEEFFFDGGVRYHSILDPRTGQPGTKCRSVTVIAKDALTAEALSRAVFVLGPKDGLALLDRIKSAEAVIVAADNKVVVTKGLKGMVQSRPPTDGP